MDPPQAPRMYLNLGEFGIVPDGICGDLAELCSIAPCSGPGDGQAPHPLVNLFPGGLNTHPASPDISQAREDERRLVPMQLSNLERDDPTFGICKHGEGQHRLHSERRRSLQAAPFAHQDRIVHPHLVSVFCY